MQRDILYIEAIDSSVEVILQEGRYRKESSLTELEKKLDDKVFFRINRQCIVNMAQIEKYERELCLLIIKRKKCLKEEKGIYNSIQGVYGVEMMLFLDLIMEAVNM
ncbi:MAG: LytTR family DNA-binding domain-containing protein [Faecalimonas umbilicata]|uniref:LytTR family DNA-binding domain-containing protein n=1 Tax=Faecalimonas umbilicata TaxID=1912855 RepID=UPI0039A140C3